MSNILPNIVRQRPTQLFPAIETYQRVNRPANFFKNTYSNGNDGKQTVQDDMTLPNRRILTRMRCYRRRSSAPQFSRLYADPDHWTIERLSKKEAKNNTILKNYLAQRKIQKRPFLTEKQNANISDVHFRKLLKQRHEKTISINKLIPTLKHI